MRLIIITGVSAAKFTEALIIFTATLDLGIVAMLILLIRKQRLKEDKPPAQGHLGKSGVGGPILHSTWFVLVLHDLLGATGLA